MCASPEFSEMHPYRKKFPKFDKLVRNIFRRIFLQWQFPRELSGIFSEVKHTFTVMNLHF